MQDHHYPEDIKEDAIERLMRCLKDRLDHAENTDAEITVNQNIKVSAKLIKNWDAVSKTLQDLMQQAVGTAMHGASSGPCSCGIIQYAVDVGGKQLLYTISLSWRKEENSMTKAT